MYRLSFQTNCYTWVPYGYAGLYPGVGYNLDYALKDLARIGYDAVEVDCAHIWDTRLWTISKEQRKTLKTSVEALGIEVEAFSAHDWPLPSASITSDDALSRGLGMEWTRGVIELAADFGTRVVTTHVPSPRVKATSLLPGMPLGSLRGSAPTFGLPSDLTAEERGRMIQAVGECADYSGKHGVLLAIEEYAPVSFWKDFVREVSSPALRINLHLAQVWRSMIRATGVVTEPSLPSAVREWGDLIAHTHCMDYRTVSALPPLAVRTTSPIIEVIPGTGECDYPAFVKALGEIGYEGYLTVECHRADISPEIQAAQALHSLKRILGKV